MYDLPLELVDIILQKSYLHWVLNPSTEQRNEEVIRSLISVDVCFNKRITRHRFKKTIWRYLKGEKSTKYYCKIYLGLPLPPELNILTLYQNKISDHHITFQNVTL